MEPVPDPADVRAALSAAFGNAGGASEDMLRAVLTEARQRWPGIQFDDVAAGRYLGRHAADDGTSAPLPAHAVEVVLAHACLTGDPVALARFEAEILPRVDPVLKRLRLDPADRDEVVQQLRTRLLLAEPGQCGKLASYRGASSLAHWVRAVAGREGLALLRRRRPAAELDSEIPAPIDLQLDHLKDRYKTAFKAAFAAAVSELGERERAILRALVIDGATAGQIASVWDVHRVTAQRWIGALRAKLLTSTRAALAAELRAEPEEVDSAIRLIESQMSASLPALLGVE